VLMRLQWGVSSFITPSCAVLKAAICFRGVGKRAQETAAGATPALVGARDGRGRKDSLGRSGRPAHGCAVMINDINSCLLRFLLFLWFLFSFISASYVLFIKKRSISKHAGARV